MDDDVDVMAQLQRDYPEYWDMAARLLDLEGGKFAPLDMVDAITSVQRTIDMEFVPEEWVLRTPRHPVSPDWYKPHIPVIPDEVDLMPDHPPVSGQLDLFELDGSDSARELPRRDES